MAGRVETRLAIFIMGMSEMQLQFALYAKYKFFN